MTFDRQWMRARAEALAAKGVYLGTSSWKYEGWIGGLYDASRYTTRGKLAKSRFERECLSEYAEVFKTVCVDAAYYTFPTQKYLEGLAGQTPDDFLFGFKVTDAITIKRFPNLARFGDMAGKPNPSFLDADRFSDAFLSPCELIRPRVGLLIFEFSRFWPGDYPNGRAFVEDLDRFLAQLPRGWPYAVELRNRNWLQPGYFDCLANRQVAHVFNSWQAMPPVDEQMALPGSSTHPQLAAARFLLKPGRAYAEAVAQFQPYNETKEVNPGARGAGAALISQGAATAGKRTFIYVNNRLEGNALSTLAAMALAAG